LSLADDEDLLALVRSGHRSAREAIRTLSATVHVEITFPGRPAIRRTARYWRSLDLVRIQEKQIVTWDCLLKDSEIRAVSFGRGPGGQPQYGASRRAGNETLADCDVWALMRIEFAGPNGGRCDFDRSLEFAKEPPRAIRETKDGRECIRLNWPEVSSAGLEQQITLWHDVGHNYFVWKMKVAYPGSSHIGEDEILEFAEPQPGIFVPTKARKQVFDKGELLVRQDVFLTELEVNQPIPDSVFQLPKIPVGTVLDDFIQGTKYPIDSEWRPIGPATPLPKLAIPIGSPEPREYRSQSTREPVGVAWRLALASLAVLIVACVGLLYRQLRRGRAQGTAPTA
jgi:hypothetical protein